MNLIGRGFESRRCKKVWNKIEKGTQGREREIEREKKREREKKGERKRKGER